MKIADGSEKFSCDLMIFQLAAAADAAAYLTSSDSKNI